LASSESPLTLSTGGGAEAETHAQETCFISLQKFLGCFLIAKVSVANGKNGSENGK